MKIWHVTIGTTGRHTYFAGDEGARRAGVRALCRAAGPCLLLFCIVDGHLHLVLVGEREDVARAVVRVKLALRAITGCPPMQAAHFTPVEDVRHLRNLVDYVLDQPRHHDLSEEPADWSGSCFSELVGSRIVRGFDPERLEAHLPRWRRFEAWRPARLPVLDPVPPGSLPDWPVAALVEAAAWVHAARLPLKGRAAEVVAARRLAAHLAREGGATTDRIGEALQITRRRVNHLLAEPVPLAGHRAARLRLAIVRAIRDRQHAVSRATGAGRR